MCNSGVKMEKKVPEWKVKKVDEAKQFLLGQPVVGIVDLQNLPSAQMQEIRKKLRGKADIRIYKLEILRRALAGTGLATLEKYIAGPTGIITSSENPFALYRLAKKNRSKAAAKAGAVAQKDIIVPAGETDLPAGPVLGDLKIAKIDVKLEKGKVVVAKDSLVAKKGEAISERAANALNKLGLKPVEVGLNIKAVYENGEIYGAEILDIDEEQFMRNLRGCHAAAINLSVAAGIVNSVSVLLLIQKAAQNARALALSANIITPETVLGMISKAAAQAAKIKGLGG